MKKITILGSTGSIGVSTLDVIEKNPKAFKVTALAAGRNVKLLAEQIIKYKPEIASVSTREDAEKLRQILGRRKKIPILYDETGVEEVASYPSSDMVVSAISGAAGLKPTLAVIEVGRDVALANKETMVIAGDIVTRRAKKKKIKILPVDSEHSAIFQCLAGQKAQYLRRIILTASGGPFYRLSRNELKKVTLEQALRHPRWKMGSKITIDSASLMNKGLEVIEARWLFAVEPEQIEVVVHPQSIVHSLVEFRDGSVVAQLGIPDMRIPIAYALSYPERLDLGLARLNLAECGGLVFEPPDTDRFPALRLACEALAAGGIKPAVLNAANEVAVAAFLDGRITFAAIAAIVAAALDQVDQADDMDLQAILSADRAARAVAARLVQAA